MNVMTLAVFVLVPVGMVFILNAEGDSQSLMIGVASLFIALWIVRDSEDKDKQ